ncbi:MAG TPA: hypothetical protein VIZ31_00990, partial [Vicinamibacteria bacterium]
VFAQFVLVNLVASYFLYQQATLGTAARVALALFIGGSVLCLGGLLDRRGWAVTAELGRLAAGAGLAFWLLPPTAFALTALVSLVSAAWLPRGGHLIGARSVS